MDDLTPHTGQPGCTCEACAEGKIVVPADGRPTEPTSSGILPGSDGNAFAVMGNVARELRSAGASREYIDAYRREAMSGDYDHLLATSIAYLDLD